MKQWKKNKWEGLLHENGTGEKVVRHSKLQLWTFFWSHGEREWPLVTVKRTTKIHNVTERVVSDTTVNLVD